ncbi:DUF4175 family protein [Zunongwangia sp. F363]|uniref:DUF4175 family protein n=1 Tax=Autumnicola tepida TaxID=3075595 RepID=A0ABU3C8Q3_9FLAO|nr:DUF4175 family protein [Zunongwangia sp. F363]MDT0642692.1 DUF4175 family protein [Zunongwangia sp. F363]
MNSFRKIQDKLERFIQKYYINQLLRGIILFLAVGLLYFLLTLAIEYFFWLSTSGRTLLFWMFVAVEVMLLVRLIAIPLVKLFKLSKGLDGVEASKLIGRQFPEVNDKLLNVLQLKENKNQSDLLLASIDQKAKELQPVPFSAAVNFRGNVKYLKFAAFPVVIIAALLFTGNSSFFSDSYERVSHYNRAYEPPAPFSFNILNDSLELNENEDFTLSVSTIGQVTPAEVSVSFDGNTYLMRNIEPGKFQYQFRKLKRDVAFHLSSNEVNSGSYHLKVAKVPKLVNFEMSLDYPEYTSKKDEILTGTGNAQIPEGTIVSWKFSARQTESINFKSEDTVVKLNPSGTDFLYDMPVYSSMDYQVSTSNSEVSNYEQLSYRLQVKKDEYPIIEVEQRIDSLDETTRYIKGRISDDYGVSRVEMVYYAEGNEDNLKEVEVENFTGAVDQFLFIFPGNIELERDTNYKYFFQVFDNDRINGSKSSKSEVFSYRKKSLEEIEDENLERQNESINGINNSLEEMEEDEQELEEIERIQKENKTLDYNQRKKLRDFIERQKRQNQLMQNYSEKLKNSFEDIESEEESSSEELQRRIESNEERLKESEAMLEELQKLAEKISREELGEKLEQMSKNNKINKRSLEQMLELTKRYYVEEKKQKLARDLEKLSRDQEELMEQENNDLEKQKELTAEFERFREKMNELEKDNQGLKAPKDLGREEVDEEAIKKDLKDAEENLENNNKKKAGEKQKDASEKMEEMSRRMQAQSAQQEGEQLDADIETLRQILDNLMNFSYEQEDLLKEFREIEEGNPVYAAKLKKQNLLKEHFEHIDDSLYTLALKNEMINEEITQNLTNIEFDIDKALERLSESEIPQGIASQQYVVTRSNNLAYLLNRILEAMQQMANPHMGKGSSGEEMQLMDIIKKQGELGEQMQQGMRKSEGRGEGKEKGSEEGLNGELYEIYKEQQKLRQQLESLLEQEGAGKNGEAIKEKMEELEEQLLDKKFDPKNVEKMINLRHELMKFQDAKLQQGDDNKRSSETNEAAFQKDRIDDILRAKEYFNATEILNRQTLPLRQIYKAKVKEYFNGAED